MTVVTKPNFTSKKGDLTKSPLVRSNVEAQVDVVAPVPVHRRRVIAKRRSVKLLCLSMMACLIAFAGVAAGLILYNQYLKAVVRRYQGFCAIPNDADMKPLKELSEAEAEMPMMSFLTEGEFAGDGLREQIDINNNVENIYVIDNGRRVNFIHDFEANISGIVDTERCFMMEMDQSLVLSPQLFVLGIERGEAFDLSRVRSHLRAVLPALPPPPASPAAFRLLADLCPARPTYMLRTDTALMLRKRSTEKKAPNYTHFAGKHVHEIDIDNMAELIEHEKKEKQANA